MLLRPRLVELIASRKCCDEIAVTAPSTWPVFLTGDDEALSWRELLSGTGFSFGGLLSICMLFFESACAVVADADIVIGDASAGTALSECVLVREAGCTGATAVLLAGGVGGVIAGGFVLGGGPIIGSHASSMPSWSIS